MTADDPAATARAVAARETAIAERDRLLAAVARLQALSSEQAAALATAEATRSELEKALQLADSARQWAERQQQWSASELAHIKGGTGWQLLQLLYKVRFALFPRDSRREAAAKLAMRQQRRVIAALRDGGAAARRLARHLQPAALDAPAQAGAALSADAFLPPPRPYTVLMLANIEWHFRFQRPQQLARQLAALGHAVHFTRLAFADALAAVPLEAGITEVTLPADSRLNPYTDTLDDAVAQRMAEALARHLGEQPAAPLVCVVQLPFWTPLAEALRRLTGCDIVYDCMDHHAGFATNGPHMLAREDGLYRTADLVVASSTLLHELAAGRSTNVVTIRNAADCAHFATVGDGPLATARPWVIGYYGAIADWFDSDLVAAIATLRPRWRLVLVGSTFSADTAPLDACANVTFTGERPYADLPGLMAPWHCCIIPFKRLPLTDATNPVKVYEMLAAGKPIVAVSLPELVPLCEQGLVALADSAAAFVAAIEQAVAHDDATTRGARRAFAAQNDWSARARAFDDAVTAIRPLVSVIIVTFNNLVLNRQCLASVLGASAYPAIEVIVVDNASVDGTPAFLHDLAARDPRVRVVCNRDNRGYAAANNQGVLLAGGRYLCLLNNDTIVHGAWLTTLVGHLRANPELGIVGPVTNAIGNEARVAIGYDTPAAMPAWADAYCAAHRGELRRISMLAFFCVVIPRHVWDAVGTLDERFGAGMFEDDDYNRRARAAGYAVRVAHDSFIHHWQKASFDLLGDAEYLRIFRRNEALYHAKWSPAASPGADVLAPLRGHARQSAGTVIFAPSVGWGTHLAQRPHHLARALARDGYTVVFDCTGANDHIDVLREDAPGLFLYQGPPEPLTHLPHAVLWTLSYNYDYRDAFAPATPVIYDWIDDLAVFPYAPGRLRALHERALREATVVASVARRLHAEALAVRGDALYLPNAVEGGRFESEPMPNPARDDAAFAAVLAANRPIAGYYGALADWFDYALLARVATSRPDWSFVLIGPDHDGSMARSALRGCANVHWLGVRDYHDLPGYLHLFDVAMIPFCINSITTATSPLKLYEYFAAGKPVVSTPMPECVAFVDVHIAASADAFAQALDRAREAGGDDAFRARLRALAAANHWSSRSQAALRAVQAAATPAAPLAALAPPATFTAG